MDIEEGDELILRSGTVRASWTFERIIKKPQAPAEYYIIIQDIALMQTALPERANYKITIANGTPSIERV